jgi:DNA-binding GntR family transcriptional regulator
LERELEETYGVSRATVKLALSALKAEALIVSGVQRYTYSSDSGFTS